MIKPEFFAAALAAVIVIRIFHGVLNRMTRGVPNPVRWSVALLILPGVFGHLLYPFLSEWGEWVDVLLLGGVALLFAVDRRTADEPPAPRWRLVARVSVIIGLVGAGLVATAAHAQEGPEEPVFVIALASQDEAAYARSVMLATPYMGGHLGVILNRPSEVTMSAAFPEFPAGKAVTGPIYVGGPEAATAVFAMIKAEARPAGRVIELMSGVWLVVSHAEVDRVIEQTPNDARYYAGVVYWMPGELAEEISRGWMAVRPADPAKLFLPDTSKLYEELVPFGRGGKSPVTMLEAAP